MSASRHARPRRGRRSATPWRRRTRRCPTRCRRPGRRSHRRVGQADRRHGPAMTAGNPQSSTQPDTSWHAEELGRLVEPALNFVEVQRRAHDKEPRMTRGETASRWMLVAGLTVALTASSGRGYAEAAEPTPGAWTGGAALGFLGNTDDRTAFAMNLNVERFLNRSFSVGPLLQFGVTGNLTQIGVSGQVKYWLNLSKALKLTAQGGLGFMHTDVPGSGTSLLVPLGVGFRLRAEPERQRDGDLRRASPARPACCSGSASYAGAGFGVGAGEPQ